MDVYYTKEAGIPEDKAARLIGASTRVELEALQLVLGEFFTLADGLWVQKRCEDEIAAANVKAEANRKNGGKGGRPKREQTEPKPNENPLGSISDSEKNLSQTPDTRHQTPDTNSYALTSGQPKDAREPEPEPAVDPTAAALLSKAMRAAGVMTQPADPRLIALAAQGVSVETAAAACETAKMAKPNERIPPAYVFAILEGWAKDASTLKARGAANPHAQPPANSLAQQNAINNAQAKRLLGISNDDERTIDAT